MKRYIYSMKRLLENWSKYLTEGAERKINIFLDMDGVLVDFPNALKDHIKSVYFKDPHEVHPNSKSSRQTLRKLQNLALSEEKLEELYNLAEKRFQTGEEYKPKEKLKKSKTGRANLRSKKDTRETENRKTN